MKTEVQPANVERLIAAYLAATGWKPVRIDEDTFATAYISVEMDGEEECSDCGQNILDPDVEDEDEPEDGTLCRQCGRPADNGEGWDGLCGNCADKEDPGQQASGTPPAEWRMT